MKAPAHSSSALCGFKAPLQGAYEHCRTAVGAAWAGGSSCLMVNAEAAEDPREMGMEQLLVCETPKSIGAHLDGASIGCQRDGRWGN